MRRPVRNRSGIGLLLAVAVLPAHAQDMSDQARQYILSATNRGAVDRLVRETAARSSAGCSDLKSAGSMSVTPYRPLKFSADGKLVEGTSKEVIPASLCGEALRFNILNSVGQDGRVRHLALLTGTTLADPTLQRDAIQQAMIAATPASPAKCPDLMVRNTIFVALEESAFGGKRAWRENWVVQACGKPVQVEIKFVPDPTGTTIAARVPKP